MSTPKTAQERAIEYAIKEGEGLPKGAVIIRLIRDAYLAGAADQAREDREAVDAARKWDGTERREYLTTS